MCEHICKHKYNVAILHSVIYMLLKCVLIIVFYVFGDMFVVFSSIMFSSFSKTFQSVDLPQSCEGTNIVEMVLFVVCGWSYSDDDSL